MRLELVIDVPAKAIEERAIAHMMVADALAEYTVHTIRNNANPAACSPGAVGLDGSGALTCRNGVRITETLMGTS